MVQFFGGAGFGGVWIAFIGWFLSQAASESYLEVGLARVLNGVTAADVMTPDYPQVDGHMNIENLVQNKILRTADRCFLVLDGKELAGL